MNTRQIIDMLIERSNMSPQDEISRSVLEFSVMAQGPAHPTLDETLDHMLSSVIGASTEKEHIKGWHNGFYASEDRELVCYALVELEMLDPDN